MSGPPMEDGLGAGFGQDRTPYEALGGADAVRGLVDAFYDTMDADESYATIRAMHDDLSSSRDKLFWFLSGWLGGPPLYVERKGHPRLRQRHAPFKIDAAAVASWLKCMGLALDARGISGETRSFLDARFDHLANFMQNSA
jgi:hemoglobin